jgi:hypothetical protein
VKAAAALSLALTLALPAARVSAATAYVSDELVLGVYAELNNQGQRLSTLHSGANVETLQVNGDYTQVRLNDGTIGWVKSAYLTTQEPATVRVKQLEDELDRSRATTPALAEAAARSEVEQLKRELAAKQSELDALRESPSAASLGVPTPQAGAASAATPALAGPGGTPARGTAAWLFALLGALGGGYWLGHAVLARRVKRKFGGIKVY